MNTLKLTLKKQWFDLIEKGIKTEEYREIKEHWVVRLLDFNKPTSVELRLPKYLTGAYNYSVGYTGTYLKATNYLLSTVSKFKNFDLVEFSNGYSKSSPKITLECKGVEIGIGKTEWGAEENTQYFVIKLGKEVSRQNC